MVGALVLCSNMEMLRVASSTIQSKYKHWIRICEANALCLNVIIWHVNACSHYNLQRVVSEGTIWCPSSELEIYITCIFGSRWYNSLKNETSDTRHVMTYSSQSTIPLHLHLHFPNYAFFGLSMTHKTVKTHCLFFLPSYNKFSLLFCHGWLSPSLCIFT